MIDSPAQQAVEYIKNSLLCFPEIKPLMHVLKRFLQTSKLNSSFNGKRINIITYSFRWIIFLLFVYYHFGISKNEKIKLEYEYEYFNKQ
jgi:hypothetical protein